MQTAIEQSPTEDRAIEGVSQLTRNPQHEGDFPAPARKRKKTQQSPATHTRGRVSQLEKGPVGDFNGKVLTNVNVKNLTEQLGL